MRASKAIVALTLLASSCGQQPGKAPATPTEKPLDGYAGLKFGMSFNDAISAIGGYDLNPAGLKDCLVQLAIRGCLVGPEKDLVPYRTIDGIPYGLELAFNRHDKLTDISLIYARDSVVDPDEDISRDDCLSINDRTVDWIAKEFGPGFASMDKDHSNMNTKTAKGNAYRIDRTREGFFSNTRKIRADKRSIYLLGHYLVLDHDTTCNIEVTFGEPASVERWEMSPKETREMERSITESKSPATSDDTDEKGEVRENVGAWNAVSETNHD